MLIVLVYLPQIFNIFGKKIEFMVKRAIILKSYKSSG